MPKTIKAAEWWTSRGLAWKAGSALAVTPIVVIVCSLGLSAVGAEGGTTAQVKKPTEPKPKPKAEDKVEVPTVPLPERPKRVVTPPTLTPAALDLLMEKSMAAAKVPLAPLTTDAEFVRRVYLDVTGHPPTPDQTRKFLSSREKDKRSRLIDRLLESPDYSVNWGRYWRDVIAFHATEPNFLRFGPRSLETWLADQLAKNRPWDAVAHDLIAASGRTDENGATMFAVAHGADPVEVAGEVSRIFLGVQIQCAQCHDHPTDAWKRQQFHEFAAFFARPKPRPVQKAMPGKPPVLELVLRGKPRYTMPDLKDPQTKIPVSPKFFLASSTEPVPKGLTAQQRHELAASLVTGQDNPWFGKAFVNRVWAELVGEPFYSAVDDIGPRSTAKSPEVLDTLAAQWQQGGYDVRWLFRTILNTRTYQHETRSTQSASGRTPFASNCPSRLRADQILDSLIQVLDLPVLPNGAPGAAGAPTAARPGTTKPAEKKAARKNPLAADLKTAVGKIKGAGRIPNPRNMFSAIFGVDPSTPPDEVLGTIPQALFLMNGPLINRSLEARPGTVLGRILATHPDNNEALSALYLRVLSRHPTAKEAQICGQYLDSVGDRREVFEDIFWSLINSTEFITRR
jgi:hypothetical protein